MTNRTTIALSNVKIPSRMRKDLGDLTGLMDSIRRHGLIQPIVLDSGHTLIAGERRYRAHEQLGMEVIDFIYVKDIPEDVKSELEFEENFWRKSMTWQEECLGILKIYRQKRTAGALAGIEEYWQRIISEMFGMSIGRVNYILSVAKKLESELSLPEDQRRYHNFNSVAEAYRLGLLAEKEDKAAQLQAELSQRTVATVTQIKEDRKVVDEFEQMLKSDDLLHEEKKKYESNPLNVVHLNSTSTRKRNELRRYKTPSTFQTPSSTETVSTSCKPMTVDLTISSPTHHLLLIWTTSTSRTPTVGCGI